MAQPFMHPRQYEPSERYTARLVSGFTLIEMLVVIAMTSIIVSLMVTNFNRSRNDLSAAAPGVEGGIRQAQNLALSGSMYGGSHRCGFGVTFSANEYTVYAGPVADGMCAMTDDFIYGVGDDIIEQVALPETLEFRTTGDVYFVPPLPYTYLNGKIGPPRDPAGALQNPMTIRLGIKGKACDVANCREVTVDRAGRITTEFQ